jgi:hypothetical protein
MRISFSDGVHTGADFTSKGYAFAAVIQAAALDAMAKDVKCRVADVNLWIFFECD